MANEKMNITKHSSHGVRIYTGLICFEKAFVRRKGRWNTSMTEYPQKFFPFHCTGALSIFSGSLLSEINNICPYHCTGLQNNGNFSPNSTCSYKYEDVFFGSCLELVPNIFRSKFHGSNVLNTISISGNLQFEDTIYAVHTDINKASGKKTIASEKREKAEKTASKKFYLDNSMFLIHDIYSNWLENKTLVHRKT